MNLDVEVFVHGVPNGESFWGNNEDRNYFGNFYNQRCADTVRFLIQTRSSNGKAYCYYNYLVYNNVVGNDGREGSYFGLSIRFDAYCKNYISIYKVLDTIFTTHVLNKILKNQNGKLKYAIRDFASSAEMENIRNATLQLIKLALTNDSFCRLKGFVVGGANLLTGNLYETTPNEVENVIRQYGRIALSPYYETVRERTLAKQYDSKLQQVTQQYEERLKADSSAKDNEIQRANASLANMQDEYNRLHELISKKDSEISQQNNEIARLRNQIKQIDQNKKNIKNIEQIKVPIMELAKAFNTNQHIPTPKSPEPHNQRPNNKTKRISFKAIVPYLTLVFILLILFVILFDQRVGNKSNEKRLQQKIEQLEKENRNLRKQLYTSLSSVSISVEGYSANNPLKIGETYEATVNGCHGVKKHSWRITGADIKSEEKGKVKFVPISPNVIIKYSNDKGQAKRILKAK